MDKIHCAECNQTFCSKYNLLRHTRNKHSQADMQTEMYSEETQWGVPGAHLGAPGAPLGAPGAHLRAPGAHLGAPGAHLGAHLGAPGAHLGSPGAHLGAPGAHLGAPVAHLGAHLGAPRAHSETLRALQYQGAPPPHHAVPLGSVTSVPPPQHIVSLGEKAMLLQHPFTMMISGPTSCGKTTFVKELLLHHDTRIQPSIQRTVWLYRRCQPLYTLIQKTVSPRVQFIQGIPGDLDDDDFFDPTVNNLLVIDDLFSEAGKDKRITGLYTEGSHHRSLSVIGINQNVFGTKDPTQRRNCHYLVLFKNPMYSQSVMSLAQQMYPGRSEIFMKAFAKATNDPYGYLLIDLKPFTPETERLKSKVVWQDENDRILTNQEQDMPPLTIKEDTPCSTNHSSAAVQTVNINTEQQ